MAWDTSATTDSGLTEDTTVNIAVGSTAAQIQAQIDAQPKVLNGYTLTFQFDDGTYTLTAGLNFHGFVGGVLRVLGNTTETDSTVLHTSQQVHINASGHSDHAISIQDCSSVRLLNLKVTVSDTGSKAAVFSQSTVDLDARYGYYLGVAKTASNSGIYSLAGSGVFVANYVSNVNWGFNIDHMIALSVGNDDTSLGGAGPNYGLRAANAARIGKSGSQPAGTTANEQTTSFGEIG